MLSKCCTKYASKFGNLSSDHSAGKSQFSFQSQRRTMTKNVQTTTELDSFYILVKLCSKSFNLGFDSMWTENVQKFKLDLQKAEETAQISNIHQILEKAREFQIYFWFNDYVKTFNWVGHNKLENSQGGGNTRLPTCLLWNLYAHQKATVRTRYRITDWFKIGKGFHQGYILSPFLFNLYAEYIIRNARLDEAQAGIKIAGRNISNLRYACDNTLWQKARRN